MEDQNKQPISDCAVNVSPIKVSKVKCSYFEFEIRILTINHELFVFHLKNEGLLKVLPQMKIKTLGVS